jgi:hypothetical protein
MSLSLIQVRSQKQLYQRITIALLTINPERPHANITTKGIIHAETIFGRELGSLEGKRLHLKVTVEAM